ncbi:MAG: SAM-dependent methyltransferase, partial [Candidatus Levyibacteriota bacterium]
MTPKNPQKKISASEPITASFRDPSGFVFSKNGTIYRQVNHVYKSDYEFLMSSGLYKELVEKQLLVSHEEEKNDSKGWKVIKPQAIPLISYWYEWPFSMVKDAAILTLQIQKIAIQHGMSLKDASAFNIQFLNGKPILIDTLSFEKYEEGKPWVAYKQFVEHFLAPLALMSYTDVRLNRLGNAFLDGIPVDLAAHLLPIRARLNPRLLFHIFAHAASTKKYSDKKLGAKMKEKNFSKHALLGLLDNLEGAVKSLKWKAEGTEWEDYYEKDKNNYQSTSIGHKETLVRKFVAETKAKTVWDLGANTG